MINIFTDNNLLLHKEIFVLRIFAALFSGGLLFAFCARKESIFVLNFVYM
jgi:hypothetical protein